MRALAQALLLAPAFVGAAPSKIAVEKATAASPSTFVTFDVPPALDEDHPTPYTIRFDVLEAPEPCAYPNVKVNGSPLSLNGHTLGRGTFTAAAAAPGRDGATFVASWSATCAGDEQLLRFALESLAGRALASDVAFVARFRQTAPPAVLDVTGANVRLSDHHHHQQQQHPDDSLPEFDRHHPRPGDDEDRLLEDPPFPPPPHHRVGDHPDNHHPPAPPPPPPPPGRHMSPDEEEHVRVKLHELDCLRHQLLALKHAIHAKESHLAQEHGILPPPRHHHHHHRRPPSPHPHPPPPLGDCDSLRCVFDAFVHRLRAGLLGERGGRDRRHHHHHHQHNDHHHAPPASCPGFPFPGHESGNHTLPPPPPPPPPGSCHCPPSPPEGPPEGPHPPPPPFHEPHPGPPGHHEGPPPPFDEPHRRPPGHHEGPHPPPPFHGPHHGPPGHHEGSPPPPPPHPFGWLFHGPPPPPPGFPPHGHPPPPPPAFPPQGPSLPVKIATTALLLVGLLALASAAASRLSSRRNARHRREKEAFEASLADFWSHVSSSAAALSRAGPSDAEEDQEKRAFLSGVDAARRGGGRTTFPRRPSSVSSDDFETTESMTSEITQFRNAATLVTEMVAAEERRQRMHEQQQQQQPRCYSSPCRECPGTAVAAPLVPTAAFVEYTSNDNDDDGLPAYDEHAPSVVVSDGFSSYSPGSSEYVPSASSSDTASNIDSVLGDPKN